MDKIVSLSRLDVKRISSPWYAQHPHIGRIGAEVAVKVLVEFVGDHPQGPLVVYRKIRDKLQSVGVVGNGPKAIQQRRPFLDVGLRRLAVKEPAHAVGDQPGALRFFLHYAYYVEIFCERVHQSARMHSVD